MKNDNPQNIKNSCPNPVTTGSGGQVCCCGPEGWGGRKGAEIVLRLLIIFAAFILCCLPLTGDLYGDEGHTLRTVSEGALLENLNRPDSCHPPLFFALAMWCRMAIGQDWAIRVPSILAALGTLMLTWPLCRRLLGERYVTAALLLVGSSPLLTEFAAEARPYAMLVFFSTALLLLMARFVEKETWPDAVLLAIVAAAGLMTHFIFAAQLVFVACWYLWRRRRLTRYSIAALVLFAPVGYYLVTGAADDAGFSKGFTENWRQQFSWLNYLGRLPFAMTFGYCTFRLGDLGATRQVGMEMIAANWPMVTACIICFAAFFAGLLRIACKPAESSKTIVLLIMAVLIPLGVGLLGGKAGFYLLREKYFIGSLVPYLLAVLLCLDALVKRWRPCAVFVVVYAVVVGVSLYNYTARADEFSRRTFRSALNADITAEITDDDAIVCYVIRRLSPWYYTVMDDFENVIDLRETLGKKASPEAIEQYARTLSANTPGDIFVVSREMDRNAADPRNRLLLTLTSLRPGRIQHYGRNLQLHVFKPNKSSRKALKEAVQ